MPSMIRLLSIFVISFFLSSCEEEKNLQTIPFAFVNQDINLNLIQYQNLRNIGGYVYISGENSGFKGLLIYHEGNDVYRVFDRACSFDPYANCDPLVVDDSGLFIYHACCKASFDFHGNATGGPATVELRQYDAYLDGIYLIVRNN